MSIIAVQQGRTHSPSKCLSSSGQDMVAAFAAGVSGEPAPERTRACNCPCRGCQAGKCVRNGTPPMEPEERTRLVAELRARRQRDLLTRRVLRPFELPEGRAASSYRFLVEALYCGRPVDGYLTDHADERDRLVTDILDDSNYSVRVTDQASGDAVTQRNPHDDDQW